MEIHLYEPNTAYFDDVVGKIEGVAKAITNDSIHIEGHTYDFMVLPQNLIYVKKDNEPFLAGFVTDSIKEPCKTLKMLVRQVLTSIQLEPKFYTASNDRLGRYGLKLTANLVISKIEESDNKEVREKLKAFKENLKIANKKTEALTEYYIELKEKYEALVQLIDPQ
jgi:hypothetical protein